MGFGVYGLGIHKAWGFRDPWGVIRASFLGMHGVKTSGV